MTLASSQIATRAPQIHVDANVNEFIAGFAMMAAGSLSRTEWHKTEEFRAQGHCRACVLKLSAIRGADTISIQLTAIATQVSVYAGVQIIDHSKRSSLLTSSNWDNTRTEARGLTAADLAIVHATLHDALAGHPSYGTLMAP